MRRLFSQHKDKQETENRVLCPNMTWTTEKQLLQGTGKREQNQGIMGKIFKKVDL